MSHIKDKILSIEISLEAMLYTYMNVYRQTGEHWKHDDKNGKLMNMQESLASCVSDSAILPGCKKNSLLLSGGVDVLGNAICMPYMCSCVENVHEDLTSVHKS